MKKFLSALFATSYFLAQLFIYTPVSYAAVNHQSIGDTFKITDVSLSPVKAVMYDQQYLGTNSSVSPAMSGVTTLRVTWQLTQKMADEIAGNQIDAFWLYRSYGKSLEELVSDKISPQYYYYDDTVQYITPTYRLVASYTNGKILSTKPFQYGVGEIVNGGTNVMPPSDNGNQNPSGGSSGIQDFLSIAEQLFSKFSSANIGIQPPTNANDFASMLDKMVGQDYFRIDDLNQDGIPDVGTGLLVDAYNPALSTQENIANAIVTSGGAMAPNSEIAEVPQEEVDALLEKIKSGNSDTNMSGPGYSDDATDSANYALGLFDSINPVNIASYQCQYNTGVLCVVENIIRLALSLASLIAIAFVVYGGYLYITSAGNQEGSQAGIKAVTNAAIGLVIILASWIIINTVLSVISQGTLGT